ncbi:hypothetical protein LCGC14_0360390 [marine sediment metagenome]|uniref:Uncharacterized protein n=1 Tax=marine sediment metagenome TaxID=412755 RepID=A0A0F9T8E6_9ZZZZ
MKELTDEQRLEIAVDLLCEVDLDIYSKQCKRLEYGCPLNCMIVCANRECPNKE